MAKPPNSRPLTLDDVPGAPSWINKLLEAINAFNQPVSYALERGLTFSENFAGEVKTIAVTPPDDWEPLTLLNSVTRWNTVSELPAARKGLDGLIYTKGLAKAPGTVSSPFFDVASFPESMWPALNEDAVAGSENGTFCQWGIGSGGKITLTGGTLAAGAYFSLGFRPFPAADRTPPRWATPIDVRLGTKQSAFPGRPGAVLALRAKQASSPTKPALVTAVDWEPILAEGDKRTPGIRIHRLWGLSPGIAYTVQLLVLPE